MNFRLMVLSMVASCCPAWVMHAAVDANELAATRAVNSGVVRLVPLQPLRISSASIVTRMVQPKFPFEMRRSGMPGYVKLELAVDDDGRVCDASVLESSAFEFAESALKAAGQWRFAAVEDPQPARRRIVRVPIQFDLVLARR